MPQQQQLAYFGLGSPGVSTSLSSDEDDDDDLDSTCIYEHPTPRKGDGIDEHLATVAFVAEVSPEEPVRVNVSSHTPGAGAIMAEVETSAESRVDCMLGTTQGLLRALSAVVTPPGSTDLAGARIAGLLAAPPAAVPPSFSEVVDKPGSAFSNAATGTPTTNTPTSAASAGTPCSHVLDELRFRVNHLELELQRMQQSSVGQSSSQQAAANPPLQATAFQRLLAEVQQHVGGICKQQAEVTQDLNQLREHLGGLAMQVTALTSAAPAAVAYDSAGEDVSKCEINVLVDPIERLSSGKASVRARAGSRVPVILTSHLGNIAQATSFDALSARVPASVCAPVGAAGRLSALGRYSAPSRFSTGSLPATPSVPQRYSPMSLSGGHGLVRRLPSAPSQLHLCPATAVRAG